MAESATDWEYSRIDYLHVPLAKKLGIREGSRVVTVGGPVRFAESLPAEARILARPGKDLDVVLLFVTSLADLRSRFEGLAARLAPDGGLWVAYPKKASGVPTDLTFTNVQEIGLGGGLVDNKSIAVDDTWSGVRFVIRVKDRKER